MKSRTVLIVLATVTIAIIIYAVITREQRSTSEQLNNTNPNSIENVVSDLAQGNKKEQAFLNEISGIWQENVLGDRITLDLRGETKTYELGSGVYKLTVKSIDLEDRTVCFDALYNQDTKPHQMCIRQVLVGSTEFYLVVDDEFYSAPWQLFYIRALD